MKLEQVLAYLHQKYDNAEIFQECTDEFSPYDAESSITLLEYKSRRADYPEIMIEGLKIQKNLRISKQTGKKFVYVSEFEGKIRSWDINKLVEDNYDFGWTLMWLPVETDITDSDEHMWKIVGFLNIKDATEH